ncbi:MAG: SDR family oxidoreductase [Myxococcota bacterium]|nr:SDR family oxidoreductase [Myxococcota bacterium]
MRKSLDGQRLLVFGATGGIGRAVCAEAHAAGARLHLSARSAAPLEALATELGAGHTAGDVTDSASVDAAFAAATAHLGGIDGVVLAVGSVILKPAHRTSDTDWDATRAVNLDAAVRTVRAAAKAMMRNGGGNLVLFSTAAAHAGVPNHAAIAAAKAGVEGLVRATAATYAGRGLRINAVAPGLVETPLTARITGNEAARAASEKMHGLGRIGDSDDIAHAVRFLLETTWTTGQVLIVDGGLSGVKGGR